MFCINKKSLDNIKREIGTDISVMIPTEDKQDWVVISSAIIFPDEHYVELSPRSTAANLVHTFFIKGNNKENKRMYRSIYSLKETEDFSKFLETNWLSYIYFLRTENFLKNKEYMTFINKVSGAVAN